MARLKFEIPIDVEGDSDEVRELLRFIVAESDDIEDEPEVSADLFFEVPLSLLGAEDGVLAKTLVELIGAVDVTEYTQQSVEVQLSPDELSALGMGEVVSEGVGGA